MSFYILMLIKVFKNLNIQTFFSTISQFLFLILFRLSNYLYFPYFYLKFAPLYYNILSSIYAKFIILYYFVVGLYQIK